MWARVLEFALACWLALSPFIFRYDERAHDFLLHDLSCTLLVMAFAFLSFWKPLRRMHLLIIPVALWLTGLAFLHEEAPPPVPYQNYVVIGVLLLVFAIIPGDASDPPEAWTDFMKKRRGEPSR